MRQLAAGGLVVLLLVAGVTPCRAQTLGTIAGAVKDATGAVLPGVTVEVASPALIEKTRAAATDGAIDGRDYPISNSALDTVALKRIDATTIERTGKIKGMPTETAVMKLSNRNKTMTITSNGTNDTGARYSRIEVFNKQ
jgi:hypothetical protein